MRWVRILGLLCLVVLGAAAAASAGASRVRGTRRPPLIASPASASGIHKIKHVVIIMQENRSFDSYFGTYPGADGIPGVAGNPGTVPCMPDPGGEACVQPFHDRYDVNLGGRNDGPAQTGDIDGGKMDGFIAEEENWYANRCHCGPSTPEDDVMGYHTGAEIPNYWKYAHDFVLQDHMFGSVASWSLPSHLFLVSAWSAKCTTHNDPTSCTNSNCCPDLTPNWGPNPTKVKPTYAWTDLTYLLYKHSVSWRYYIFKGIEPACESDATLSCTPVTGGPTSMSIWYPLKYFDTVQNDHQVGNVESINSLYQALRTGSLPAVSWVMPSQPVSEHPPGKVSAGQTYVTTLINAIMRSPAWGSTAIFVSWDDWSGFYDHVNPPIVDINGYGMRVPGLLISPYAKQGYIDHQTLSFDAYLKFIEDDFLGGQRLDPNTDGRPDPRTTVRETVPQLGNLLKEFDFKQTPRKPVILPVHPKTDLIEPPAGPFSNWNGAAAGWG